MNINFAWGKLENCWAWARRGLTRKLSILWCARIVIHLHSQHSIIKCAEKASTRGQDRLFLAEEKLTHEKMSKNKNNNAMSLFESWSVVTWLASTLSYRDLELENRLKCFENLLSHTLYVRFFSISFLHNQTLPTLNNCNDRFARLWITIHLLSAIHTTWLSKETSYFFFLESFKKSFSTHQWI